MRLTDHTDYSLRVLMLLNQTGALVTLEELSQKLKISRNNLIKVSNQLTKLGWIKATRGRSGGLLIEESTGEKTLKEIIMATEENFNVARCFSPKGFECTFLNHCPLRGTLRSALDAFLNTLETKTLNEVTPGLPRKRIDQ